jgi:hypothetical protein
MSTDEALAFFKTRDAIAEAASVTKQAVSLWFKSGWVPRRSAGILRKQMNGRRKPR